MPEPRKIRVLIVDDSAIVRKALSEIVASHPDLEVVGTAPDPFVARDKILALKPDVVTLDIEMPRMDGVTFLKKLMRFHPLPVVVISSLGQASSSAAMEAMQAGAVEVIPKPGGPYSVADLRGELAWKIRAAAEANLRREPSLSPPQPLLSSSPFGSAAIVGLGASTGGVEALRRILEALPEDMPPVVVVQHIPPVFSGEFARRLDKCCRLHVKEAENGEALARGRVLIAPGNFHLTIRRAGNGWTTVVEGGPQVQFQRPSVDVLFHSLAKEAGREACGAILTGMGADGAAGLLAMRQAGASTLAQSEETCVVFGMPREAIRMNAAGQILPLDRIPEALVRLTHRARALV